MMTAFPKLLAEKSARRLSVAPDVWQIDDVLSASECEAIIKSGSDFERSRTGKPFEEPIVSDRRTSFSADLFNNKTVDAYMQKIMRWIGADFIRHENTLLRCSRLVFGHLLNCFADTRTDSLLRLITTSHRSSRVIRERRAKCRCTFLTSSPQKTTRVFSCILFLNSLSSTEGGCTCFTLKKLRIQYANNVGSLSHLSLRRPKQGTTRALRLPGLMHAFRFRLGSCVLWSNVLLRSDGTLTSELDSNTLHAGEPTIGATKFAINTFISMDLSRLDMGLSSKELFSKLPSPLP